MKLIIQKDWLTSFIRPKTTTLENPYHFRDFPNLTGRRCTHCFLCQMICPSPGAIKVIKSGEPRVWNPEINPGHCIRCGLCIEICPEMTLESGRILSKGIKSETWVRAEINIKINPVTCCGCGSCAVSCPITRQEDKTLASKGTRTSDRVILGIEKGITNVFDQSKCSGCCTCADNCPSRSIAIIRVLEMKQGYEYEKDSDNVSDLLY